MKYMSYMSYSKKFKVIRSLAQNQRREGGALEALLRTPPQFQKSQPSAAFRASFLDGSLQKDAGLFAALRHAVAAREKIRQRHFGRNISLAYRRPQELHCQRKVPLPMVPFQNIPHLLKLFLSSVAFRRNDTKRRQQNIRLRGMWHRSRNGLL